MFIPPKIARFPVIWELRKLILYATSLIMALIKFRKLYLIWDGVFYFPVWWKYLQKKNERYTVLV